MHRTVENSGPALRDLLTVVVPTRNRPELLRGCLRSIFEQQSLLPSVIVSDNSTRVYDEIANLQHHYNFIYVQQSGALSIPEHFNACIGLVSTPWLLLLHDDDELYPGCFTAVQRFLPGFNDVGIVIGSLQYLDQSGNVTGQWQSSNLGVLRSEAGLLALGLNFPGPPSTFLAVSRARELGGYEDVHGLPNDYALNLRLAYSCGVAFVPDFIGQYRMGHDQQTNVSSPEKTAFWLNQSAEMAHRLKSVGCSEGALKRLVDYRTWSLFREFAPKWWKSHRGFVFDICQKCMQLSPEPGKWQSQVRQDYPFLFWRPRILAWPVFRILRKLHALSGRKSNRDWYRIDWAQ